MLQFNIHIEHVTDALLLRILVLISPCQNPIYPKNYYFLPLL